MTLDEKIYQYAKKLPHSLQEELLDFIQYLLLRTEQKERREWQAFSLSSAMRDMDGEPDLYHSEDIKVHFA